jgi:hypothetical protein
MDVNTGLTDLTIMALALNGSNLYATTLTAGLFVSTNNGESWTKADSSSINAQILSLAADQQNLYAGTSSNGVIYRPVSGITSVSHPGNVLPGDFKLYQNYPNPFNPSTVIRYRLPVSSHAVFKIFDVLGRQVETLLNEQQIR